MTNQSSSNATSSSQLEMVVSQFEHWRETRGKRGRIPDALWALVAPLMNQYSHTEIAAALKLNHAQMKERVAPLLSKVLDKSTTFVECALQASTSEMEHCVVEFTCKNGSAVKISGLTATQVHPLVSVLIGG